MTVETCMILAAGFGTRLRPITDKIPKPLVEVGGEPVLLRTLKILERAGMKRAVINLHYKGEQIQKEIQKFPASLDVVFSIEEDILETGGGLKKALPFLGDQPFLVINSDAVWLEEEAPLLPLLMKAFSADRMDALLAMVPYERTLAFRQQQGDFAQRENGTIYWPKNRDDAKYVYVGIHMTHPKFIAYEKDTAFSLTKPWRDAEAYGRLHGLVYDGAWVDMGTHAGLLAANNLVAREKSAAA